MSPRPKRPDVGPRAGAARAPAGRAPSEPSTRSQARAQSQSQAKPPPTRRIPLLEWLVAALGATLVAGAIGYLCYQALWRDATPPAVSVVALPARQLEHGYLVEFRATNHGGQAAAQIVVEGELHGPEGVVETSEATIEDIAPRSDRAGGLFFTHDPRGLTLRLRAKGYTEP